MARDAWLMLLVSTALSSGAARMPTLSPFSGAKIALLCDGQLLTYQRDDKPGIPWPGLWDLPGGGRESDESPLP